MKHFLLLISSYFFAAFGLGQTITLVDQDRKVFESKVGVRISSHLDIVDIEVHNGILDISDIPKSDSIYTLEVYGIYAQKYFNQFSYEQLKNTDTIALFYSRVKAGGYTKAMITDIDSIEIFDYELLVEYISALEMEKYRVELNVYNTYRLSVRERRKIKEFKKKFSETSKIPLDSLQLNFKNIPYTSFQDDFFASGTVITKSFIKNQNTAYMKQKAQEYSLVISTWIVEE